ncbi:hypothetical protein ABZT27_13465, partial [Streptomyces sp. NPDC005389]
MDETRLRRELREAALTHRPDRARMLARVERGMATPAPAPAARPPRPATVWGTCRSLVRTLVRPAPTAL